MIARGSLATVAWLPSCGRAAGNLLVQSCSGDGSLAAEAQATLAQAASSVASAMGR